MRCSSAVRRSDRGARIRPLCPPRPPREGRADDLARPAGPARQPGGRRSPRRGGRPAERRRRGGTRARSTACRPSGDALDRPAGRTGGDHRRASGPSGAESCRRGSAVDPERDRLATDLGETTGHRDRSGAPGGGAGCRAGRGRSGDRRPGSPAFVGRHMAAVGLATDRDRLATEGGGGGGERHAPGRRGAPHRRPWPVRRAQNTDLASLVAEAHLASARLDAEERAAAAGTMPS